MLGTLHAHGLDARGLDLVNADVTGDVADALAVAKAVEGCRSLAFQPMPWPFGGSVLHTAGLHAPNLDYYSAEEFERVNVEGTRRLLEACRPIGAPLVFSSTTSLMHTRAVKEVASKGTVVLRASEDYGTPRNIYGVTKKRAEELCRAAGRVAILRCSRFFAEDMNACRRSLHVL